ncbi:MAG: OmpA-OmpF porin, OOP family [Parcubacteria group bacterium Gr01-1014_29]|nr:MAG: OmpA-OmpF porin, OOP family [Parcubacteria group bacterium Gr01-1014_29]
MYATIDLVGLFVNISSYIKVFMLAAALMIGVVYVYAASPLPESGLTPESPFYFLDIWDETVRLFFTRSDSVRLTRYIQRVSERLSETDKLAGRGIAATQKALELYRADLPQMYAVAERMDNRERIANVLRMATDHLAVLDHISERTDVEKKRFVLATKEFVINQQLQTLESFERVNAEEAYRIYADALERRMARLREVAIDKQNNNEALREYAAYLSELEKILREWETLTVNGLPPATFLEVTVRGHEATLLGPVFERVSPILNSELLLAINYVRGLSGLAPLEKLPPRAPYTMPEDEKDAVIPGMPLPTPIPSPQPIPIPQPIPEQTPTPAPSPAPTVLLSRSPSTISQGNSSTLSWSSTNTTSCTASGGWSGPKATSGSLVVTPSLTTVYTISCTGAGGNLSRSTTITVTTLSLPPPPPPPAF